MVVLSLVLLLAQAGDAIAAPKAARAANKGSISPVVKKVNQGANVDLKKVESRTMMGPKQSANLTTAGQPDVFVKGAQQTYSGTVSGKTGLIEQQPDYSNLLAEIARYTELNEQARKDITAQIAENKKLEKDLEASRKSFGDVKGLQSGSRQQCNAMDGKAVERIGSLLGFSIGFSAVGIVAGGVNIAGNLMQKSQSKFDEEQGKAQAGEYNALKAACDELDAKRITKTEFCERPEIARIMSRDKLVGDAGCTEMARRCNLKAAPVDDGRGACNDKVSALTEASFEPRSDKCNDEKLPSADDMSLCRQRFDMLPKNYKRDSPTPRWNPDFSGDNVHVGNLRTNEAPKREVRIGETWSDTIMDLKDFCADRRAEFSEPVDADILVCLKYLNNVNWTVSNNVITDPQISVVNEDCSLKTTEPLSPSSCPKAVLDKSIPWSYSTLRSKIGRELTNPDSVDVDKIKTRFDALKAKVDADRNACLARKSDLEKCNQLQIPPNHPCGTPADSNLVGGLWTGYRINLPDDIKECIKRGGTEQKYHGPLATEDNGPLWTKIRAWESKCPQQAGDDRGACDKALDYLNCDIGGLAGASCSTPQACNSFKNNNTWTDTALGNKFKTNCDAKCNAKKQDEACNSLTSVVSSWSANSTVCLPSGSINYDGLPNNIKQGLSGCQNEGDKANARSTIERKCSEFIGQQQNQAVQQCLEAIRKAPVAYTRQSNGTCTYLLACPQSVQSNESVQRAHRDKCEAANANVGTDCSQVIKSIQGQECSPKQRVEIPLGSCAENKDVIRAVETLNAKCRCSGTAEMIRNSECRDNSGNMIVIGIETSCENDPLVTSALAAWKKKCQSTPPQNNWNPDARACAQMMLDCRIYGGDSDTMSRLETFLNTSGCTMGKKLYSTDGSTMGAVLSMRLTSSSGWATGGRCTKNRDEIQTSCSKYLQNKEDGYCINKSNPSSPSQPSPPPSASWQNEFTDASWPAQSARIKKGDCYTGSIDPLAAPKKSPPDRPYRAGLSCDQALRCAGQYKGSASYDSSKPCSNYINSVLVIITGKPASFSAQNERTSCLAGIGFNTGTCLPNGAKIGALTIPREVDYAEAAPAPRAPTAFSAYVSAYRATFLSAAQPQMTAEYQEAYDKQRKINSAGKVMSIVGGAVGTVTSGLTAASSIEILTKLDTLLGQVDACRGSFDAPKAAVAAADWGW